MPEIQEMILSYQRLLGGNCFVMDQAEEDTTVLALKALANIGPVARAAGSGEGVTAVVRQVISSLSIDLCVYLTSRV